MPSKTVVVVEDSPAQRNNLVYALENRGFCVTGAATVAEARQAIDKLREKIDVMVLDMRLEDPAEREVTGAEIGIQLQREHPGWLPEYFIQSDYTDVVNYYQLALRLGAAAYLSKDSPDGVSDVVRHVRALALRRALRLERSEVAERLTKISDSTKNLSTGVRNFCREILKNELDVCLGAPYLLLLTDETGTHNFATNTDLPLGHEDIYTALQAMAHGIADFSKPYVLSRDELRKLPGPANSNEAIVFGRLAGAAFIPLANVKIFRLSLGLLQPLPEETQFPEDPEKLASVLAQYVRSTIVEHILRILVHLDSQKRAMLKGTARFCVFLGQDQQRIIEEGVASSELEKGSQTHHKLGNLAADLWDTGTILTNIANSDSRAEYPSFELSELIEAAFADLTERMNVKEIKFVLRGTCHVHAKQDDIYIAVIRVLQWLVQRRLETPPEVAQRIIVECVEAEANGSPPQVIFEDRSYRLPNQVREQLFMPFSVAAVEPFRAKPLGPGLYLPLFLAKMLVEEKYGGFLNDRSDDLPGGTGHRLVMSFASQNLRAAIQALQPEGSE
jgi:DNA-binding NarL/FixJ family response regulator